MADRKGFEPSRRSPAYALSRRAPSTTRPPVRWWVYDTRPGGRKADLDARQELSPLNITVATMHKRQSLDDMVEARLVELVMRPVRHYAIVVVGFSQREPVSSGPDVSVNAQ